MKTAFKIFLLIFGIAQLGVILFLCIPTIPTKIQNETTGTEYTFDNISFDQISQNLTPLDEETLAKFKEKGAIIMVWYKGDSDRLTIMRDSEESKNELDDEIVILKNPFRHRTFESQVAKDADAYSTTTQETGRVTKTYLISIFEGENKTVLLNRNTATDGTYLISLAVKFANQSYTVIFTGNSWNDDGDIDEFIRTVSLSN